MEKKQETNDWGLVKGQGYVLNRGRRHAAAGRLNLQFYLWKDSLQFNIHPSILPHLPKTAAIADVASGSGIWLIDVSRQLPHVQLDGLDYDLDQAPHVHWLPSNVKFIHLNILEDIPDDLVGKYDFVHTRLLVLVVESKNPRPIIQNLRKLLKPGGYLQWDELDTVNMSIMKADPNLQAPALEQVRDWSWADGRHDWTVRLPQFLTDEGFCNATIDFFGDSPDLRRAFTDQHLLTIEEFAEGLSKLGKPEAASKYFNIIEKAHEESINGNVICVPRIICTARKPL